MKCSYCGNELEKDAQFCPECGMILGLDNTGREKNNDEGEPTFRVPEYTPNVFRAVDEPEEISEPARELEADTAEELAPVTENIPEFTAEPPEYKAAEISDYSQTDFQPENSYAEAVEQETEEAPSEETAIEEAPIEEAPIEEAPAEETPVQQEPETAYGETQVLSPEQLAPAEYVPAPDAQIQPELDIRVPESEITYPEYESYKNQQTPDAITPEEEYEEITSDYSGDGKKKGPLAIILVLVLICAVIGGVYAVKNVIPTFGGNDTTAEDTTAGAVADDTTEEDTTEEDTTEEDTTEEDTTEEDTTEEDTTEEDTTEEEESEAQGSADITETTESQQTTATTVATTKPAVTTTRPAATTTKPAATTTKPAATTTDPYGIADVEVKKPSATASKTYILYCTAEGVILRSGPSASYPRVLYLSKGADLTVYAQEDGYYYVRSNRYGVNGWVSASYTSEDRPETETTKVYKNTVSPDGKYEKGETKYTTTSLNIRKGPGTSYEVVSLIPGNYPVKLIGYKKGVSGWVYVTDTTYGISGWVSDSYIK